LARKLRDVADGLGTEFVADSCCRVPRWLCGCLWPGSLHQSGQARREKAEQRPGVERFHRRHRPRGDEVTVLAGGTSAEELIERISIGVGAAIKPGLGLLVALAIGIENLSEALSIGELIRDQQGD
jgi:zinc transporter ZupT